MRATQTTTYRSLQTFLDRTSDKLADLQLQAATGKRINSTSDDPTAISPMLSARTQIQTSDRYIETIDTGLNKLDSAEGYLDSMENTMVRIKEITIASINGAMSSADMETYANEVSQLRASLLSDANAQIDGKYIFAGFAEKTAPFTLNSAYPAVPPATAAPVNYNGDNGSLAFEIAPNELVEVNLSGNGLLLGDFDNDGVTDSNGVDIFALVTTLEEALRSGGDSTTVATPDATATTTTAAIQPEVQTLDLASLSLTDGDDLTFTTAAGTFVFNNADINGDGSAATAAQVATAMDGTTVTDGTSSWTVTGAGDSIVLTQVAGEEAPIGAITYDAAPTSTDPATLVADRTVPGVTLQAESQALDLSGTTVAAGDSFTLTIGGSDFSYTNNTGASLNGAALASVVASGLSVANYTLVDGGAGIVNISQNVGSESDIDPITTTVDSVGTSLQDLLETLEIGANQLRSQRSLKGTVGQRLEIARDHMVQISIDMEALRSSYEDADILETITEMQKQQQSFEAALNITGKVSDLSILNYI